MLNDNDLNLRLLAGMPIKIDGLGTVTPLTLQEIIELGESAYDELLSSLLIDKSAIEGLEEVEINNLELLMVFCYQNDEFKVKVLKALNLFLKKEFFVNSEGFFYCKDAIFYNELFDDFQYVLRRSNHMEIKKEPDYKAGNEQARKFIEKLKRNKQTIKKPETINLHSIISGVAWKSNNTNIVNIFDLTMYQLYDAYHRLLDIDNYHYTLSGIYAGTVDGKDINLSNFTWSKILKN